MTVDYAVAVCKISLAAIIQKQCAGHIVAAIQQPAKIVAVVITLDNRVIDWCVLAVNPRNNILIGLPQSVKVNGNRRALFGVQFIL